LHLETLTTVDLQIADELHDLYQAAGWWDGRPPTDRHAHLRALVAGSVVFLLARGDDGRALGMGRAIGDGVSDAYLQDIFVRPEHRGQGLGRALVARLVEELTARDIGWIGLVSEPQALRLYERLGFFALPGAVAMRLGGPR